jgi:hypothetical protein
MARVSCRCGETLKVTAADPDRLTCPRCGAKIRIRRSPKANAAAVATARAPAAATDGFFRFHCPCGRRLKVRVAGRPEAGKCPDCGRIVPVPEPARRTAPPPSSAVVPIPTRPPGPGGRTDELDAIDLERLERWASRWRNAVPAPPPADDASTTSHRALEPLPEDELEPEPDAPGEPPVLKMEAGLRVCPRCGKPLHMSATVCRTCGEPVPRR